MKLPDTQILNPENYMTIVDPWRQEWERGVQVGSIISHTPLPPKKRTIYMHVT